MLVLSVFLWIENFGEAKYLRESLLLKIKTFGGKQLQCSVGSSVWSAGIRVMRGNFKYLAGGKGWRWTVGLCPDSPRPH